MNGQYYVAKIFFNGHDDNIACTWPGEELWDSWPTQDRYNYTRTQAIVWFGGTYDFYADIQLLGKAGHMPWSYTTHNAIEVDAAEMMQKFVATPALLQGDMVEILSN